MFWKYYFRLLAGLFLVVTVGMFLGWQFAAINGSLDVVDRGLALVSLVGLFGYAWKQQLLPRLFWRVFVPLYVIWGVVYASLETPPLFTTANLPEIILALPLVVPLYYALVRYAYGRSVIAA